MFVLWFERFHPNLARIAPGNLENKSDLTLAFVGVKDIAIASQSATTKSYG